MHHHHISAEEWFLIAFLTAFFFIMSWYFFGMLCGIAYRGFRRVVPEWDRPRRTEKYRL